MRRITPEKIQKRLDSESGASFKSWTQNHFRVALVYPNSYEIGMANLGYQTVYHAINKRDDCLCERFFLPDQDDLSHNAGVGFFVSYESGHRLMDFDLIALSVSFENDYLNLPIIFDQSEVPLFADQRDERHPLVLLGGVCAFINPEPLADLVDIVAVGEAEALLPELLELLVERGRNRADLFERLKAVAGIYLPSFYCQHYDERGVFSGCRSIDGTPNSVRRVYVLALDASPSRQFIQSPETDFGSMFLTEVSRGCSRGCRFCAAGFVYLPPRERSLDNLLGQVDECPQGVSRIGLVAAAVADYSQISALQSELYKREKSVSTSSLRLDALTAEDVVNLKRADHRTVAIAPEAGSQKIRDFINKGLDHEQIIHAVRLLADGGIRNLKLYFMVGFAVETDEDIQAIISLTAEIAEIWRNAGRERGSMGTVTLSVNPFVPKPFTPLQWDGMDGEKQLKKKYRFLQSQVSRMANVKINCESIRLARIQAFFARGDRRLGRLLSDLAQNGNLKQVCRKHGLDVERYISLSYDENAHLPWEVIDQGIDRDYLWNEYLRAYQGRLTGPCVSGCRRCGVC